MAAIQVLNSPELLSLILHNFEEQEQNELFEDKIKRLRNRSNQSMLASLARVNHLWFETATRVLWSYGEQGPTLRNLAKIEASRQQIYASKLASIIIEGKTGHMADTTALSFPRVRRLYFPEIGGRDGLPPSSIKQYLRPSIHSIYLRVRDKSFDKELLTGLESQCSRLRSLRLVLRNHSITDVTPGDFNEFFRKQPLEYVFINVRSSLVTKGLMSTLGRMEDLRSLSIISYLSLQQIPECFLDEGVGFFRNLDQVDLTVKREAVSSVAMAIRHASRVKLEIISPGPQDDTPMFTNLKHMKNLVDLTICFKGPHLALFPEDFCCMRTLKTLENLVIKREPPSTHTPIFSSSNGYSILKAIFGLSRLHSFSWQSGWLDVSIETLCALSHHNPNLRNLFLYGACDLEALIDLPGCLFPNLQTLVLEQAVRTGHRGHIASKRIAKQVLLHAPQLGTLSFKQDPQSKVVESWKNLKQKEAARCKDPVRLARPMDLEDMLERTVPRWRRELEEAYRPDPRDPRWQRAEAPEPQTSNL